MNLRYVLYAIGLVSASYFVHSGHPYSLSSDIAYQGFAARQYVDHSVSVLNSVRLVNPRDLSKDISFYLTFWTPSWTLLFVLGMKAGMTLGGVARMLTLLLSIGGAVGWVWMTSLLRLKGIWRFGAVSVAALFPLRTGAPYALGTGDLIVYTVAPWLIGASMLLADRIQFGINRRIVIRCSLLCLALGSVYWLKFSGIFLGIPIVCALALEHLRAVPRPTFPALAGLLALYGSAFAAPVLAHKVYTYGKAGTDLVESSLSGGPPRTIDRNLKMFSETFYQSSTVWFSAFRGLDHVTHNASLFYQRLARVPGIAMFGLLLYLLRAYPSRYVRTLLSLMVVVPLIGFPALTYATGIIFVQGIARCCAPFWLALELIIFALLSQPLKIRSTGFTWAKGALAVSSAGYLLCILWFVWYAAQDWRATRRAPRYEAGASGLYVADLSRTGTPQIDAEVQSLIRGPRDVVIPAAYSEKTFGIDMWIELGGRLLPLTVDMAPSMRTHGREGINYYGKAPFHTSQPLRVILVASNLYGQPQLKYSPDAEPCDFRGCVARIQGRFPQAARWIKGPDTGGHAEIWYADLE